MWEDVSIFYFFGYVLCYGLFIWEFIRDGFLKEKWNFLLMLFFKSSIFLVLIVIFFIFFWYIGEGVEEYFGVRGEVNDFLFIYSLFFYSFTFLVVFIDRFYVGGGGEDLVVVFGFSYLLFRGEVI